MAASAPCFLMSCTLPFVAFPVCLWRTCNNNSKHSTGTTTPTSQSLHFCNSKPIFTRNSWQHKHCSFNVALVAPSTRCLNHSLGQDSYQHHPIIPPPITHICSIKLAAWRQHRAVHQTLLGTDWRCSIVISTYYFPWNIFAVPTTIHVLLATLSGKTPSSHQFHISSEPTLQPGNDPCIRWPKEPEGMQLRNTPANVKQPCMNVNLPFTLRT